MKYLLILMLLVASSGVVQADVVKKSKSGICHDQYSDYYDRTSSFTEFGSLAACLDTGGRLPKNYDGPGPKAGTSAAEATKEAESQGIAFSQVYDRDDYNHWIDQDGDCQDQRHEVLIKTSQEPVTFKDVSRCYVDTGQWYDPYTDNTFLNASDLHIDHIVSLKYAHERGAHLFPPDLKEDFANDPQNLIPVDAATNISKSAKGPAEWLPPNQAYRCQFIERFDRVMKKYDLEYRSQELRVINRMKNACAD